MMQQLVIGSAMLIATMMLHGILTAHAVEMARRHLKRHGAPRNTVLAAFFMALFALWLFVATFMSIWAWVLLYKYLDVFSSYEDALYFSAITMTTVGYGDVVVAKPWRVLAACQAANGTFLFGWSTALVFAVVQWMYTTYRRPPEERRTAVKMGP